MRSIFAARESDKSEFLTHDEIRQLMMVHTRLPGEEKPNEKITEDEVELALQALDLNHDGKVSCEGKSQSGFGVILKIIFSFFLLQSLLKLWWPNLTKQKIEKIYFQ